MSNRPRPQDVRAALTSAALHLFSTAGYEQTTVTAIADHAGVARRTFFRHFATKDDAVLPNHEALLRRVQEVLDDAPHAGPLRAVRPAAHCVLQAYLDEGELAVRRHRLLSGVPELRERERAVVTRYQRVFAAFLRENLPAGPDRELHADVLSASVVAAHNHVLRAWLRSPDTVAAEAALDHALDQLPPMGRFGARQEASSAELTLARIRELLDDGR